MRILLVGESLAGHLSPIIAVYEAIKSLQEEANLESLEFMLISSKSHFLQEIFKETKIPYKTIKISKRTNFFLALPFGIIAFFQALIHVFDYMPDIIFSKGGAVSVPVVLVGWIFRIPIVIHESDSVPSKIDKIMFKFAEKVAISFNESKDLYNSSKVFFTGNPVRNFIGQSNKKKALESFTLSEDKPVVLILGGSEGAREINKLVLEILPELLKKYQIIHQCGIGNYDEVRSIIEKMNIYNLNDYHLFPFFKKRIADAYAACNIIVSRAGANTISEIMAVAKPSVLIPLASAVSDKQKINAFHYSEAGAAVLLGEKNLKPHLLLNVINELFKSHLKIIEMQRAARQLANPLAAKKIAEEIIKTAK
ncbi:MAG: UDP-N-acetylglucosamine--N-acetylmuramyl-(pentapeptide) pyrophosphoryl-undecaprenol N-acetylglucosamine transferase [Patescibacteria group bacterium]|nr:UDP-N-acetylglucosamine--N-acetylmuramyl-(pentapeptide) pyrophosphoryl-undecaprenol N-acetylglucosamine transferase [Patescibacteria group bacterium]